VADRQLADFIPLAARHLANEKPEYCDFVEEALTKGWIKPNPDGQHTSRPSLRSILPGQLFSSTS
jgi:hypothetical protein